MTLTGVTLRAQDARPGDLFAALPGTRMHGSRFAADAIAAGAVAVLTDPDGLAYLTGPEAAATVEVPLLVADHPRALLGDIARLIYGDPSRQLAVVGVTGTSGKTTTCYLLEAALAADGSKTGLIGTVQTRIDGEVAPSALTTPEAPDLQALFAVMLERGVSVVAMEVSSHALSLGRVSGTAFAVGAFTNLSQDHLDFHHDMAEYFAAKSLLFDGRAARHVINIDDEHGALLAAAHPGAITVGGPGNVDADWATRSVTFSSTGIQHVTLAGPDGRKVTLNLSLPGAFNVANAAMAIACIDALGRDVQQAADAISGVVVPGRMERVDAGQDFLAVVDYAHKPAALAAVLAAIREGLSGRLIVVIGAGGDRDTGKRPMMGAEAAARSDLLIVTDDNPRSEDPAAIRSAVLTGARAVAENCDISEIGDRRSAIRAAVLAARAGDAVVIAGKGHELGQDVGGVVQPFSDRDEVLAALMERAAETEREAGGEQPTSLHDVTKFCPPDRLMIAMPLARVAAAIGTAVPAGHEEAVVSSVEFDTRRVTPGSLFVALRGERVDGHAFAADAAAKGAVAVLGSAPVAAELPLLLVAAPAGSPLDNQAVLKALAALARESVTALVRDHGLQVIGVTGSSGKTSTKDLIAAVLRSALPAEADPAVAVIAPPESFNNELGHPYTALRADERTRYLVLELSARGIGHVAMLAATAPPRIGAVLNVGSAHLGEFGSVAAIAVAKSELVQALPAAAAGGVAILNADDPLVLAMAAVTTAEVVTVGTAPDATIRAQDVTQDDLDRAEFTLVTPEGTADVQLKVVGAHQVGNALAAAAVGRAVGLTVQQVAAGLSGAGAASKWRMEVTELPGGITLINDAYNANPHSMKAALKSLSIIGRGRRSWAVLGEMAELGKDTNARTTRSAGWWCGSASNG